jgi:hypothetical protein
MAEDFGIVTPGSITDFAKALREMIRALGDVRTCFDSATALYDRRKARAAAKGLATLAFEKSGMRAPLERIAAGAGTPEDIESIYEQLFQTTEEVEQSIHSIVRYKDRLRETVGLEAAFKIGEIITGQPYSKRKIRLSIQQLISEGRKPSPDMKKRRHKKLSDLSKK